MRGRGFCRSSGEEAAGVRGWRRGEDGVERVMWYHTDGKKERPQKKSHEKIVLLLFFLVVGDKD